MADLRNRGKKGRDDLIFGNEKMRLKIKEACQDMNYLLTRGFAEKSATQLVGNRYSLNARQQQVLKGMSASNLQISRRKKHEIQKNELANETVIIDGFNLLIIMESALSGAYVFKGLDDCYRDISSVHGTYKRVNQTMEALKQIGHFLENQKVEKVLWVFDKPVSNSGRLKTILREFAEEHNFNWEIELNNSPDKIIAESPFIGISSDAWILDRMERWFNLAQVLIEEFKSENEIVYAR